LCVAAAGSVSTSGATYQFLAQQGCCNGGTCYYLATDISDQALAQGLNTNYTPLLANALYSAYLPQVYQVTNYPQGLYSARSGPRTECAPIICRCVVEYDEIVSELKQDCAQISS